MLKLSTPLALLLAVLLTACASRGAHDAKRDLFLWSVAEAPDGEPVAWVLGSVHVAREGDGLDRAALDAYERAKSLAVELDLDKIDPVALNRIMNSTGLYEAGRSLSAVLGPADFERLGRLLTRAALPLEAVDRWKPWLAAMVLGFTSIQDSVGEGAEKAAAIGVDRFFLDRARGQRPIVSLETIEEQMDALTSASEAVQLAELRDLIGSLERGESPVDKILDAYMKGDTAAVEAQVAASGLEGERKAWLDRVLRDRNVHMAERAATLIRAKEKPFIVVGAGHLVGPSAVQTLLAGMGFFVAPVPRSGEAVPLVQAEARAGTPAASPARPRVVGYRVAWPCAETARAPIPTRVQVTCKAGDVVFVLSTVTMPTGTGSLVSDDQFFAIQVEQFKAMANGPLDHGQARVGTIDAEGRPLPFELPALQYAFDSAESRLMGLTVKDGDLVYSLLAVAPLSATGLEGAMVTLSSFALELAGP